MSYEVKEAEVCASNDPQKWHHTSAAAAVQCNTSLGGTGMIVHYKCLSVHVCARLCCVRKKNAVLDPDEAGMRPVLRGMLLAKG